MSHPCGGSCTALPHLPACVQLLRLEREHCRRSARIASTHIQFMPPDTAALPYPLHLKRRMCGCHPTACACCCNPTACAGATQQRAQVRSGRSCPGINGVLVILELILILPCCCFDPFCGALPITPVQCLSHQAYAMQEYNRSGHEGVLLVFKLVLILIIVVPAAAGAHAPRASHRIHRDLRQELVTLQHNGH